MPRRREVKTREITPDPKFHDRLVSRLVSTFMKSGKKSKAEKAIYSALDIVAEKMKDDPLKILKQAVENVRPVVETKSRRVGGANYQVPVEVRAGRSEALAIRWMISAASSQVGQSMPKRLATEILEAHQNRGASIKKKEDVHKMAEANKAFAHYRW